MQPFVPRYVTALSTKKAASLFSAAVTQLAWPVCVAYDQWWLSLPSLDYHAVLQHTCLLTPFLC